MSLILELGIRLPSLRSFGGPDVHCSAWHTASRRNEVFDHVRFTVYETAAHAFDLHRGFERNQLHTTQCDCEAQSRRRYTDTRSLRDTKSHTTTPLCVTWKHGPSTPIIDTKLWRKEEDNAVKRRCGQPLNVRRHGKGAQGCAPDRTPQTSAFSNDASKICER